MVEKKLRALDDSLRGYSDDYRFGNRFLCWGARIFTILFALFPLQEFVIGFWILPVILIYMAGAAALTWMNSYTGIKEESGTVKLYQKLRYLPVSWEEYSKSRRRYLWRATWKMTALCMAGQLLMCLIAKEYQFGVWNVIYILVSVGIIPWMAAMIGLYRRK